MHPGPGPLRHLRRFHGVEGSAVGAARQAGCPDVGLASGSRCPAGPRWGRRKGQRSGVLKACRGRRGPYKGSLGEEFVRKGAPLWGEGCEEKRGSLGPRLRLGQVPPWGGLQRALRAPPQAP